MTRTERAKELEELYDNLNQKCDAAKGDCRCWLNMARYVEAEILMVCIKELRNIHTLSEIDMRLEELQESLRQLEKDTK